MATKTKAWSTGTVSATIQYNGQGDGQIIITSDPNNHYEARSMQITVGTTDGSGIQRFITINQAAKQRIDISAAGDAYLTVGQPSGELPWDGSTSITIDVDSNTSWAVV